MARAKCPRCGQRWPCPEADCRERVLAAQEFFDEQKHVAMMADLKADAARIIAFEQVWARAGKWLRDYRRVNDAVRRNSGHKTFTEVQHGLQ